MYNIDDVVHFKIYRKDHIGEEYQIYRMEVEALYDGYIQFYYTIVEDSADMDVVGDSDSFSIIEQDLKQYLREGHWVEMRDRLPEELFEI